MKKISYKNYHRDKDYLENVALFKNIFRKRFNIITKFKKYPGRVLEIGSSTGTMLDIFLENGWETWGVEPSKSASAASAKGHKIINIFFEKAKLPKNYFDVVIMNHVLEHIKDPLHILIKAHSLLKKGGVILIDVPNAGGLSAKLLGSRWPYLLPEEHVNQFNRQNLSKLFKKADFSVIHFESRSRIFEYASPLEDLLIALKGRKKRFITNIISFPYALFVTTFNIGDSMTLVGKK